MDVNPLSVSCIPNGLPTQTLVIFQCGNLIGRVPLTHLVQGGDGCKEFCEIEKHFVAVQGAALHELFDRDPSYVFCERGDIKISLLEWDIASVNITNLSVAVNTEGKVLVN